MAHLAHALRPDDPRWLSSRFLLINLLQQNNWFLPQAVLKHQSGVSSSAVSSPDGNKVVMVSRDNTPQLGVVSPAITENSKLLARLAEAIADNRLCELGAVEPLEKYDCATRKHIKRITSFLSAARVPAKPDGARYPVTPPLLLGTHHRAAQTWASK